MQPTPPDFSALACAAYATFVARVAAGETLDIEAFRREHEELSEELGRLHERVAGAGRRPSMPSISAHIRARYGPELNPNVTLAGGERPAPGAADETPRGQAEGRYRLRGEVARGGQGAILRVWDEDLRRDLAMKVVLTYGDGAEGQADARVMKRFLEEAQVTGQLDHPGIVPVHELGLDDKERVYFTMKLVQGEDLGSVFRKVGTGEDGWTRARALGVMQKVCEAMAYAHHRSVIHRDLKPENVMVGRFGAVYVMDWGLARVIGRSDQHDVRVDADALAAGAAPSGGSPLMTMDGDVLGTPAYMSPEQARGDLQAMGPHSDVYAVGAMLYTLLTGGVPYVPQDTVVDNIQVWRAVTKGPPEPVHRLADDVPAELEAICEKAMQRDPAERYANMGELGADLQAYMENRVVSAHQTGAIVEFRKWVQRNRGLASACAAALLLLVGGLGVSLFLRARAVRAEGSARDEAQRALRAEASARDEAQRATRAQATAVAEAERASQAAATSEQVSGFLVDLFQVVDPGEARGNTVTAREILDRGAVRIDAELAGQPEVQSALMETMGTVYKNLGLYDAAAPLFERALDQRRDVFGASSPLVAESLNDLGEVLRLKAAYAEAEAMLREALEMRRAELGDEHPAVAESLHELGFALTEAGRYAEAEPILREALEMRRRLLGRHPAVAETLNELAFNLYYGGDRESPEPMLREALELRQELLGRHPDVAESMNNLALFLYETGKPYEASEMMREALQLKRELLGPVHPEVAIGLNNLAFILHDEGDLERAEELYREALRVNLELLGRSHPNVAQAMNNLAFVLDDRGDRQGALALFMSALDIYREVHGEDHPDVTAARGRATVYTRTLLEELEREVGPAHPDHARARSAMGGLLLQAGDLERAEEALAEALGVLASELGDEDPATQATLASLVGLYEAWGQPELAREYRRRLSPPAEPR